MKIAQPEPRRRNALLSRPVMATSSAGVALSRSGPRNRAVRWKEPSLLRTTPSLTSAAQGRKSASRSGLRRYSASDIIDETSRDEMRQVAQVAPHHVDEGGVALGRPDRGEMADEPERGAGDPEAKAEPDCRGERAVDDRHRARRPAEQDRLRQRAVDGCVEAGDGLLLIHHTSAPPPNWKKVRKKELAAKAMERP